MAIYHLEGKIISRSQGRSSVAAAAYRAAEKIKDERTNLTHDFTQKEHDVAHTEILLPDGAPAWMAERPELWNHVEHIEKRKDAQLAREFNIALPKELTLEQNIALAREFVQQEFVARGMVADLCIHLGHKGGEEQPHMHVMLCLRELTAEGFGKKVREWNDKDLIHQWREAWAERCNAHLALHHFDVRIDHRTLEAQGINLEPQTKIGAKVAYARMARFEEHQQIAEDNGKRILSDPNIALHAITRQQSTFTHQDIARFVNRHSLDKDQFEQVFAAVKASPELVALGKDDNNRERFTTKAMLALEAAMIEQSTTKANQHQHTVKASAQQHALKTKSLTEEQKSAFEHIINSGDVACVVGFAGTGKSYMLGVAKKAWEQSGYRAQGMTLSGIAAENLEGGSDIKSFTIANRLINWENGRERLNDKDIVVVDEAGMVGSRQMAAIMNEATLAKAKVVLVGDPEQLQAIEAGAAFRAIAERTGFIEMTDIRRQQEHWQADATKAFALNKTAEGLNAYEERDHAHDFTTKQAAMTAMIEQWQETRSSEPRKSQIMLAYTRVDVYGLNEKARITRKANGELGGALGQDHEIETSRGVRSFAEGDRIYFLRNEKSLNVRNGTLGTIERIENKQLTIRLDAEETHETHKARRVHFHVNDYNDLDHGYAATIHKSQGVTVDRSYLLASKYLDRHATYVALSRHRMSAEIYWSRDEFPDFKSLQGTLSRKRLKDTSLDYALARGLDVPSEINVPNQFNEVGIHKTHEYNASNEDKTNKENLTTHAFDAPLTPETKARYNALLHQAAREYSEQQMDEFFQKRRNFKTLTRDPPQEKALTASLSSLSIEKLKQVEEKPKQTDRDAHWNAFCQRDDFSQFKTEFEKSHPEQARELKEAVRPAHERSALDALKQAEAFEKATPLEKLQDNRMDWELLRNVEDETVQWIVKFRDVALEKATPEYQAREAAKKLAPNYPVYHYVHTSTPTEDIKSAYLSIKKIMKEISQKPQTLALLKEKAPKFAEFLTHKYLKPNKALDKIKANALNWLDKRMRADWEKLRLIKNSKAELMVQFYDVALKRQQHVPDKHEGDDELEKSLREITKSLGELAFELSQNKRAFPEVEKSAPELIKNLVAYGKAQERQRIKSRGMEREWDD